MPQGGDKLFLMQSYHLFYSGILPQNPNEKETMIQDMIKQYEQLDSKTETSLDKAMVDEIYILYSYLKGIDEAHKVILSLKLGEKLKADKLEGLLRDFIKDA